jgi:hypothetical protein
MDEFMDIPMRVRPYIEIHKDYKKLGEAPRAFTLLDVLGKISWRSTLAAALRTAAKGRIVNRTASAAANIRAACRINCTPRSLAPGKPYIAVSGTD